MELPSRETLSLLYFLLPGFLAAWVFYGLTAHPKKEAFERTVQALIFTFIVRALSIGARKFWWVFWHPTHLGGLWTDEKELVTSLVIAVGLGVGFSVLTNWDLCHRPLRFIRITKRTSYPSEWYSGFHRFRRTIILHLKGERRLRGWADEWPDQCDKGHFLIQSPIWLDAEGKEYKQEMVERTLVSAEDVEMVEFLYDPENLPKTLDELVAERDALAKLHKPKETKT